MRRGSFSDLCWTGNKHHRLSYLKAVLWGLVSSAGAARLAGDTGIQEVTVSPSCWQEAVAVGTVAVALAGCPLGRNSDAIAGGGHRLWEAAQGWVSVQRLNAAVYP